ncbi:hypothetical protein BXA16_21635 [Salmonella enterica subsp. enterica serovar Typhimurium]|nr:hypothetical protein BXA16_21635 [Salmonella enterica subsp. enterica serovar Typhimurium]
MTTHLNPPQEAPYMKNATFYLLDNDTTVNGLSAVEQLVCWPQKRNSSPRDILISLRTSFADFATAFTEVVDFVPYEETLKQLARERYKAYRVAGFNLNTATWK